MTISTAPPMVTCGITLPRDPDAYVREHATAIRETLGDAVAEHHDKHIPWHFEPFAPGKYGYVKRGAKYQRLKDRMGLPPLVSPNPKTSGNLRDVALAPLKPEQVTKTQYRATLRMRLPFKGGTGRLRLKPGQTRLTSPQEQILYRIAELQAISSDERKHLAEFIGGTYAGRINQPGVRRKVKFGG